MSSIPQTDRSASWIRRLRSHRQRLDKPLQFPIEGRLTRMVGLTLEAVGCQVPIGGRCEIISPDDSKTEAEVVGFSGEKLYLMPTGDTGGLVPNARVLPQKHASEVLVGDNMLGRVVDGGGKPLDGKGPIQVEHAVSLNGRNINPMLREPIVEPLDVGVRAINSLLTVGRGQRMGLFAGSGVGKSVLLGMMTKFTSADVVVVGLIGERGREVRDFVQNILGEEGMQRAAVVAVPADYPPLMRLQGAALATSIAEHYRDQGKQVLLLMDSLTRYAQAQREVALAIGEPPATRGYPPSVFTKIPKLVERAGCGDRNGGSITAFYTVLTEGDDPNDPIADAARAILDGHLVLSRDLAEQACYPAINIEASISRLMMEIIDPAHLQAARLFKQVYSTYQKNRDLISVGAYQAGSDPRIDEAIILFPRLIEFIQQGMNQKVGFAPSLQQLGSLFDDPGQTGE